MQLLNFLTVRTKLAAPPWRARRVVWPLLVTLALTAPGWSVARAQQSAPELRTTWRPQARRPDAPRPRPAASPATVRVSAAPAPAPTTLPPAAPTAAPTPAPAASAPAPTAEPTSAEPRAAAPAFAAAPAPAAAPTGETPPPEAAALGLRIDSLERLARTLQQQVAANQQGLLQRLAGLGNFRFNGDIRVRYESFVQSAGFATRERERVRGRFGFLVNAGEDFSGGMAISTGALEDPQSANQTETGFFTRKVLGFDRYYVTYHPHQFRPLTITGGKFTYPWYRTSLTFGNDVNPEGITGTLGVAFGARAPVQSVSVVGFYLTHNEVAAGADGYIAGGQLQAKLRLASRATLRLYAATLDVRRPDAIAVAIAGGTLKPASATNTVRTDSAGRVVGYAGGFLLTDLIAAVDVTLSARLPLTLLVDVVSNHRVASEGRAWQFDARLGRLSTPGDVQLSYTHYHIERDAVLSAFNEQDLRAGTNVVNHRFGVVYQWQSNVALQASLWLGHLLHPEANSSLLPADARAACAASPTTGCSDPTLRRLQLDVVYKL